MTPKRVDDNQAEIVNGLRAVGALVLLTHTVGDDCPDMFVWFRGRWTAHEVKSERGRLTAGQQRLRALWPGAVCISRTLEEALDNVGAEMYTVNDSPLPPRRAVRIKGG